MGIHWDHETGLVNHSFGCQGPTLLPACLVRLTVTFAMDGRDECPTCNPITLLTGPKEFQSASSPGQNASIGPSAYVGYAERLGQRGGDAWVTYARGDKSCSRYES